MIGLGQTLSLSCLLYVLVAPYALSLPVEESSPRPLVIWHGLGDTYASKGMNEFGNLIKGIHAGIFIHSVYIDEDVKEDQRAGFYGNVDDQIELVAEQLADVPELSNGFDAIGFSQGGQFLRAYVERFNSPPIHNLITFGSQHMGISDIPLCRPWDLLCQVARRAARSNVYSHWAQTNLIQAQYFRDPDQLDTYLSANHFLTSINNEVSEFSNSSYAENLSTLNNLVLVLFSQDKTVVPKESAWFGSYAPTDEDTGNATLVPMRQQPLYTEDMIGLRTLDKRGGVTLKACEGEHMQITKDCWEPLVQEFVGGTGRGIVALHPEDVLVIQN